MDTLRSEEAGAKLNVRNYGRVTNMVRMIPAEILPAPASSDPRLSDNLLSLV
jgi:hypothetical protein